MPNPFEDLYIIDKGVVRKAHSVEETVAFFDDTEERIVWQTQAQGVTVSTVFLSIDHSFCYNKDIDPILYETMVFADDDSPWAEHADQQCRYATRENAIHGHLSLLNQMGIKDDPPGFEHPSFEEQMSRLQLLMESD